jgi:membrane protease YdiL (CAAX protease family)
MIVLTVAVATPVVEELTFRGLLLRYLEERMNPRRALILSAALFGAFHVLGTNGTAGATIAMVQTFLAGLVLAYVTQKSGRLSRAIFVHGGFNLVTILVLFLFPDLAV